jgi:hypothetical protein
MNHISQVNKTNQFGHPASPPCHIRRSYADGFTLLNIERMKWKIPYQDTDFVDFTQVIR